LKELVMNFIKSIIKAVLFRPKVASLGARSYVYLPRRLINKKFIEIGRNCRIGKGVVLEPITINGQQRFSPKIFFGNDVYVGRYCQIYSIDSIRIEDGCVLSEYVYLSDSAHGFNPDAGLIMQQDLVSKGPIHIGENTFIGYGVAIMPGVSLGRNCIVGMRSVVTRSFPDFSMIVGSPARIIKKYCQEKKEWISI
jgi:acetyltransferase-like isoleucine patch superfamily enzyme